MSCHNMSCLDLYCHVMPCHVMSCLVLSCLVMTGTNYCWNIVWNQITVGLMSGSAASSLPVEGSPDEDSREGTETQLSYGFAGLLVMFCWTHVHATPLSPPAALPSQTLLYIYLYSYIILYIYLYIYIYICVCCQLGLVRQLCLRVSLPDKSRLP